MVSSKGHEAQPELPVGAAPPVAALTTGRHRGLPLLLVRVAHKRVLQHVETAKTMLFKNLHTVEEGKVYRTGKLSVKTFEEIADRLEIKTLFRVICLHRGNREYFEKLDAACKKKGHPVLRCGAET